MQTTTTTNMPADTKAYEKERLELRMAALRKKLRATKGKAEKLRLQAQLSRLRDLRAFLGTC